MLTAVRELQIPLLAALLLGGCAAKGWRVLRSRSMAVAMDPAGLFPLRLRRPVMIAMCATEVGLGLPLLPPAGPVGPAGSAPPPTTVRGAAAPLLLGARGRA